MNKPTYIQYNDDNAPGREILIGPFDNLGHAQSWLGMFVVLHISEKSEILKQEDSYLSLRHESGCVCNFLINEMDSVVPPNKFIMDWTE